MNEDELIYSLQIIFYFYDRNQNIIKEIQISLEKLIKEKDIKKCDLM